MTGINLARVVLGGLLAGVVINAGEVLLNAVLLEAELTAAMARLNLPPVGGGAVGVFVTMGFLLGITIVWLYAAIRPRFGAGVKTALIAGTTVWALAYLYGSIGYAVMGFFPARLITIGAAWGLGELLVASVAGAWLYTEPTAAPAAV